TPSDSRGLQSATGVPGAAGRTRDQPAAPVQCHGATERFGRRGVSNKCRKADGVRGKPQTQAARHRSQTPPANGARNHLTSVVRCSSAHAAATGLGFLLDGADAAASDIGPSIVYKSLRTNLFPVPHQGGSYVSSTRTADRISPGGTVVLGCHLSCHRRFTRSPAFGHGRHDDDGALFRTGRVLAPRGAESNCTPQS